MTTPPPSLPPCPSRRIGPAPSTADSRPGSPRYTPGRCRPRHPARYSRPPRNTGRSPRPRSEPRHRGTTRPRRALWTHQTRHHRLWNRTYVILKCPNIGTSPAQGAALPARITGYRPPRVRASGESAGWYHDGQRPSRGVHGSSSRLGPVINGPAPSEIHANAGAYRADDERRHEADADADPPANRAADDRPQQHQQLDDHGPAFDATGVGSLARR